MWSSLRFSASKGVEMTTPNPFLSILTTDEISDAVITDEKNLETISFRVRAGMLENIDEIAKISAVKRTHVARALLALGLKEVAKRGFNETH